jgi:hypothetical protein
VPSLCERDAPVRVSELRRRASPAAYSSGSEARGESSIDCADQAEIPLCSCAAVVKWANQVLQPTAPPRRAFGVDLSQCDSVGCHLRLPEPRLSLVVRQRLPTQEQYSVFVA